MSNSTLEIIPFKEEFAPYFYELNVAWLKKYFYVEPYDELVLSNPQSYIIDKGGFIFFGRYQNEIVGVVSLINQGTFFELSKMAVKPQFQGLKFGLQLMEFTIEFAKSKGYDNVRWLTQDFNYAGRRLYDTYAPKSDFILYSVPVKD